MAGKGIQRLRVLYMGSIDVASLTILKDGTIQLSESLFFNPDCIVHADFEVSKGLYYSPDRNQFIRAEKREGSR